MAETTADRARAIFEQAVETRAPRDWAAFVPTACGDDRELRADARPLASIGDRRPVPAPPVGWNGDESWNR